MILLLILLVYYLGAVATLLLICKNASLEKFLEEGERPLYKIACIMAVLIWPITIIIGLILLIFKKNEENT